ncbi:MAG: alpha/beta fold hydrolase [Solirubrobacteraceae bacterium]
MRRAVAALAAAAALVAAVAPAHAAGESVVPAAAAARLDWRPCAPALAGFECARLLVPLDRTGAVAGTIALRVARQMRAPRRGAGVLLALAGGPGQGAVAFAPAYEQTLAPALRTRRLVVIDQRGTGASGALRCPRLQRTRALAPDGQRLSARCARHLGPRRDFYSTTDTVDDIEALRRALGVPRLSLQGTSYGTYVATQYARRYPSRVDRLVLDSSVGPDGVDALLADSWSALPRILAAQCSDGRCRAITDDPLGNMRTLAARLEAAPLRGFVVDGRGRRVARTLTAPGLAALIVAGDLDPHLQAALPAAVRSGLAGDAAPLLRLIRPAIGAPLRVRELSLGLNAATTCADTRLAYGLSTPLAERPALMDAAVAAAPEAALGPFSRPLVAAMSIDEQCLSWPVGRVAEPVAAPLPDVPALILGGSLDVRTPLENDRALAAQMPRAQLVVVPGGGHDAIDGDLDGCVRRALSRFFAGRRAGDPCARSWYAVPPQPVAPVSLATTPAAPGVGGRRGQVLAAAVGAVHDVREAALQLEASGLSDRRGGGLRAGRWRTVGRTRFVLRAVSWVPGVRVSGRIDSRLGRYRGTVRVDGPGRMDGVLRFARRHGMTGRLGGRRVQLPARAVRGAVQEVARG